jgi:nucleotide-binding universal stress UspA family protein
MTDLRSYKKIVVPIDGSGWSERAIPHALANASGVEGAEIILLHIFRPPAHEYTDQIVLAGQEDQINSMRDNIKQYLMGLRNKLRSEKVNVRVQVIEGVAVAHLIIDYVNEEGVDLVVMSTHGRTGLARFLFGSVANKILQGIKVPVLLVRPDQDKDPVAQPPPG